MCTGSIPPAPRLQNNRPSSFITSLYVWRLWPHYVPQKNFRPQGKELIASQLHFQSYACHLPHHWPEVARFLKFCWLYQYSPLVTMTHLSMLAPLETNVLTTEAWPWRAAMCRAVLPSLSSTSTRAPGEGGKERGRVGRRDERGMMEGRR